MSKSGSSMKNSKSLLDIIQTGIFSEISPKMLSISSGIAFSLLLVDAA
jgi:hypothetical protein